MTPLPKCACRIVSPFGSRDMAGIEYCRLHLAAPALLEALKKIAGGECSNLTHDDIAKAAIAEAKA